MKVAMVTHELRELPDWVVADIAASGIDLVCRRCRTGAEVAEFAAGADVIWIFGPNPGLDGAVLERLPKCRAIFRSGSGVDQLPVDRATELGVAICNTPDSISEAVAEHAAALILALVRQVPQLDRDNRELGAAAWNPDGSPRMRWHLTGRTLGLVGYGRIARKLEAMLTGFRLKVLYFDPVAPGGASLDEVLAESDIISLHCPLTPETARLVNAGTIARMKDGVLIVNTSRGGVIDEPALAAAVCSGKVGGAALDVLETEPPTPDCPLLGLDNVIITPHQAAFSGDFEKNFWGFSVRKLQALAGGDFVGSSINLK